MTDSHYPHKCPQCGAAAYIGGDLSVDCSGTCRHGRPIPPGGLMEIASNLPWRGNSCVNDSRCPTPEEYVGELLQVGSSLIVDQHLEQADSQPAAGADVMWENRWWDVDVQWCQDMAKEIRRRLDTNLKMGVKYSETCEEVHVNAGQLGLLKEAHEALKISITNDPRDCRRIESLQKRISKSLCSVPDDTIQVPRAALEECEKLAYLGYLRNHRGDTPMPERVAHQREKKFLDLWHTIKRCLTP